MKAESTWSQRSTPPSPRRQSRSACRRSCAKHRECSYWTWRKGTPTGPCYLKTSRDGVRHGMTDYVSGSKGCLLPEDKGQDSGKKEEGKKAIQPPTIGFIFALLCPVYDAFNDEAYPPCVWG